MSNAASLEELLQQAIDLAINAPAQGLELSQKLLQQASTAQNPAAIGSLQHSMAVSLHGLGRYDEAIALHRQALQRSQAVQDWAAQAKAHNSIALCYLDLSEFEEAQSHFEASLELRRFLGDSDGEARVLHNLGMLYRRFAKPEQALDYYQQTLERFSNDPASQAQVLNNMGFTYYTMGQDFNLQKQTQAAHEAFRQALALYDQALSLQEPRSRAGLLALGNSAAAYLALGQWPQALSRYEQTLALAQELGNRRVATTVYLDLGLMQQERGEYPEAERYLLQALNLCQEMGLKEDQSRAHLGLSQLYESWQRFSEALQHHKMYHNLVSQFRNEAIAKRAQAFAIKLDLERAKHQAELHRLRSEELAERNRHLEDHSAQLSEKAYQDGLTGLRNRHFLNEWLVLQNQNAEPLGLMVIDIDHFKRINDRWGHLLGDEVLRRVSQTVQRCSRNSDWAVRYGGEELVLLLPHTELDACTRVAERIRMEVEQSPWLELAPSLQVTISVGIACGPAHQGQRLLQQADAALYQAKHQGRNQVCAALPHQA